MIYSILQYSILWYFTGLLIMIIDHMIQVNNRVKKEYTIGDIVTILVVSLFGPLLLLVYGLVTANYLIDKLKEFYDKHKNRVVYTTKAGKTETILYGKILDVEDKEDI